MAEKKAQHGKNSVDENGFLAQSTRHPFRDPDSPREPDPQETKVKKILSSVFAVVFAMAFSLVCQPSVSSAAPQGAPATRQNQPAHQSVRNVKQNHAGSRQRAPVFPFRKGSWFRREQEGSWNRHGRERTVPRAPREVCPLTA